MAAVSAATSSGATTTPAWARRTSSAATPSVGTAARIGRSAARYSKIFPDGTVLRAHPHPEEQEERLRVALQLERRTTRHVRDLLDALAEPELVRELAIRRAQAADEARDDIVFGFRERRQERTRIAVAEERAGVRDPELLSGWYSRPSKSSKSQPFGIVSTRWAPSSRISPRSRPRP